MKKLLLILLAGVVTASVAFAHGGGMVYGQAMLFTHVGREASLSIWAAGSENSTFGYFHFREYAHDGGRSTVGGGTGGVRNHVILDLYCNPVFDGDCEGADFWWRGRAVVVAYGYLNGRPVFAELYVEDLWSSRPANYFELYVWDAFSGGFLFGRWGWSMDGRIRVLCSGD